MKTTEDKILVAKPCLYCEYAGFAPNLTAPIRTCCDKEPQTTEVEAPKALWKPCVQQGFRGLGASWGLRGFRVLDGG